MLNVKYKTGGHGHNDESEFDSDWAEHGRLYERGALLARHLLFSKHFLAALCLLDTMLGAVL